MMSSCSTKFLKYTVCQYITQFTDSILMSGQLCTFYLDRVYCLERAPSRTSTVRVTCLLTHTHKRTHSFHDILNCGLKKVGSWRYCCQMIPVPRELMFVSRIRNPSCADGGPSVEHDGVSLTPSKGAKGGDSPFAHPEFTPEVAPGGAQCPCPAARKIGARVSVTMCHQLDK